MNHRLTQIALAVAALGLAPAASALTPPQINAGGTVYIWLSGASAPTAAVFQSTVSLCSGIKYKDANGVTHTNPGANDVDIYLQSGTAGALPGGAGDHLAYTCTVETHDGRAGSLEGQKVVVYHTVSGGSFNSYAPHLVIAGEPFGSGTPITNTLTRLQNITGTATKAASCSATRVVEAVTISGESNNIGIFRGCANDQPLLPVTFTPSQSSRTAATQQPDRPDGGFSDTEYAVNKELLGISRDEGDIGFPTATNVAQAFGVGVSYPLYYQLQLNDAADGRISSNCTASPASATSPNLAAACQPNLTAQRYSTIAFRDSIASVDGDSFFGLPGTSKKIKLHRRVPTSGTQSASELRFLVNPTATGPLSGALRPSARIANSTGEVDVLEHASTSGVKNGLTAATDAEEFGLGFLSLENIPGGSDRWAFVKLDGVSPNTDGKVSPSFDPRQRTSAIEGSYTAWYELVAFTSHAAAQNIPEASDLISTLAFSLSNPNANDLAGLFISPLAGVTGPNVGKGSRLGNSAQPALHFE